MSSFTALTVFAVHWGARIGGVQEMCLSRSIATDRASCEILQVLKQVPCNIQLPTACAELQMQTTEGLYMS